MKTDPGEFRSLNPKRCPFIVSRGRMGLGQCGNARGSHKDGWCGTHDPQADRRRREKKERRWVENQAAVKRRRVAWGLADATIEELEAELLKRKNLVQRNP